MEQNTKLKERSGLEDKWGRTQQINNWTEYDTTAWNRNLEESPQDETRDVLGYGVEQNRAEQKTVE